MIERNGADLSSAKVEVDTLVRQGSRVKIKSRDENFLIPRDQNFSNVELKVSACQMNRELEHSGGSSPGVKVPQEVVLKGHKCENKL